MAAISRMKPDQVLYQVVRQKMGNTTISRGVLYTLKVVEVDPDHRWVIASWNGNTPRKYYQSSCNSWRVKQPQPKGTIMGMSDY